MLFTALHARSAGPAGADRGGLVRVRLCAAGAADQSVRAPPRAQPVPAPGRARAHHLQRAADRLRPRRPRRCRRPTRSKLHAVRPGDRRRHQGLCRRRGDRRHRGAVRVLPLHARRQGDPRLRRQLHRRAGGRPRREAALRADLRARRRLRRRRRHHDGALVDATPMLGPGYTLLAFVIVITGGLGRCRARSSAAF